MNSRLAARLLATAAIVVAGFGITRAVPSHAEDAGAYSFELPVIGLRLPDAERAGIMGARGTPAGLAPARPIRVVQAADGASADRNPARDALGPALTALAISEDLGASFGTATPGGHAIETAGCSTHSAIQGGSP